MEPPGPHLRRRTTPGDIELTTTADDGAPRRAAGAAPGVALSRYEVRTAAGAGAAALALSSSGEVVLLAVLLGAAAGEVVTGVVAMLATGAVALRWGSTSLDAIAGAQSVLGPGAAVGPAAAAASTWCAAAALVLAKPRGWSALLFGLTAGLVLAGPAASSLDLVAMRVVMASTGAALALGAQRWMPPASRRLALVLAVAAVALALFQ